MARAGGASYGPRPHGARPLEHAPETGGRDVRDRRIPEATVARLPVYLQALVGLEERGVETVSSDALAAACGVNSAKLRKDLSFLGTYGTRGVGYQVVELVTGISEVLGLSTDRPVVICGIGNLGRALASYGGFDARGFRVVGLLDADPGKVGTLVAGHTVEPISELGDVVRERGATIAVVATPADAAQPVVDTLVAAGVTAVLNFAPAHLQVPEHVTVRRVDLSTELQILSFYEALGADGTGEVGGAG
ncbi:MAG: redox-sensing transcriptional repressor Rex [Actinomycetes bacterium]